MKKSKKKNLGFFGLSTGTLGGAIIIIIFNILLGEKAPWFVERLSAQVKDIYSIRVNVENIFDKKHQIGEIDSDTYHVDSERKFYLKKPPTDLWEVEFSNPGHFLDDVSVAYVPFLRNSITGFSTLFGPSKVLQDDITTTNFSNIESGHEIEFAKESKIGGIPFNLNPFQDLDIVKSSIRAGGIMMRGDKEKIESLLDESTEEGRKFLKRARVEMVAFGEKLIKDLWPKSDKMSSEVSVTTFRKSLLEKNPMFKVMSQGTKINLYKIMQPLMFINPELSAGNVNHIDYSKDGNSVLFDTSTSLENIIIDGEKIKNIELVRIILVTMQEDTVYVVTMKYLYGLPGSRSISRELEALFASFRVTK